MAKNPLAHLASLGEDVLGKASQNPTARARRAGRDAAEGPRRRSLEARARARADGEARWRSSRSGSRSSRAASRLRRARRRRRRSPTAPPPSRRTSHASKSRVPGTSLGHVRSGGTRTRRAPGTTSKTAGVVPDLLALELDRQLLGRVDLDARRCARPPPSGARRACPCRSSARSSGSRPCRRRRSGRRRTAPSSGGASGRELHPAAVPDAVRDDHVVHPPAPLAAVEAAPSPRCSPTRRRRASSA